MLFHEGMLFAGLTAAAFLLAQAASPSAVWPPPPVTVPSLGSPGAPAQPQTVPSIGSAGSPPSPPSVPSYGTATERYQPPAVGSQ